MEELWALVLDNANMISDDNIVRDSKHDYVDLIEDLGYDSVSLITLIVDIEEMFNIEIDDRYLLLEELRKFSSLTQMVQLEGKYIEK